MTTTVTRYDLQQLRGMTPKLLSALEALFVDTAGNKEAIDGAVSATGAIQNATVFVLSANAAFNNERILTFGEGLDFQDNGEGEEAVLMLSFPISLNGGFGCTFNLQADTNLDLPSEGRLLSSAGLSDFADDAAAATGGVAVGGFYRTGSSLKIRVA